MEIKPCPICGEQPRFEAMLVDECPREFYEIECSRSYPVQHSVYVIGWSEEELVEAWNTRYEGCNF